MLDFNNDGSGAPLREWVFTLMNSIEYMRSCGHFVHVEGG